VSLAPCVNQGCQMVNFLTKSHNLGKFWRILQRKMLVHLMVIWSIFKSFGKVWGHFVSFVAICYIFPFWYVAPRKIWQPWRERLTKMGHIFHHLLTEKNGADISTNCRRG
jgi:hypothetical protein